MVAISYTLDVFEAEQCKLSKDKRRPCSASKGTVDSSLLGTECTVNHLKEYIEETLGCKTRVSIHGPKICEAMGDMYLSPYERRCLDKFYVLDGILYRHYNLCGQTVLKLSTELTPIACVLNLSGDALQAYAVKPLPESADTSFDIVLKTLTARSIPLVVDGATTVVDLKYMLQDSEGIPPGCQQLVYGGQLLEDGRYLAEYNLDQAAAKAMNQPICIHLVLRLRGGMFHSTSGRNDNKNLSSKALSKTQVTVVVPGHGEVQLRVPVRRRIAGKDLLQLVNKQLAVIADAAAAAEAEADADNTRATVKRTRGGTRTKRQRQNSTAA